MRSSLAQLSIVLVVCNMEASCSSNTVFHDVATVRTSTRSFSS